MIAAVRNNPCQLFPPIGSKLRLVAFGLDAGIGEIQILDAFDLDMQPSQLVAHHIGTFRAAGKLLSAPRIKSMLAQE